MLFTLRLVQFIQGLFGKVYANMPLKTVLIVPFVLQICGAVALIGYLSFKNGQLAVENLANQLEAEISNRAEQHLDSYLKTPRQINQINVNAIELGLLSLTDLGVIGVDLILSQIDKFLNSVKVSKTGKVFILERSGLIVVASTSQQTYTVVNGQVKRVSGLDSNGPLIRAITQDLVQKNGSLKALKDAKNFNLTNTSVGHFVNVKSWCYKLGLDWLIVVVIPESNLMEQINANTDNTVVLCFVAFVMATYIGILTARWIGNPIMQLKLAAKKIAKGRWKLIPDERTDEVGELALEFRSMAILLQESFAVLSTKNKDLKVLNASLLASESRLHQFLEAMPMGVFIVEAHGKPHYINQIGKQILPQDLIPEARVEDLARLYQVYIAGTEELYPSGRLPISRALQGESSSVDDIEIRHPNRTIPIEVSAMPIYDQSGEISFAVAAFADISQRKQAQQLLSQHNRTLETQVKKRTFDLLKLIDQLKTVQQELMRSRKIAAQGQKAAEQANKAKSEFLTNMSHELRTPLNAILGFTQLMSRDTTLLSEHQQNLAIINRAGEHLLNLINDILEMSKIEAGHTILNLSNFDLIRLLDNLQQMLHRPAAAKGLTLTFEYQPNIKRYIQTDASKLRQVLLNLLGNAIKFTKAGSVTLRVRMGDGGDGERGRGGEGGLFSLSPPSSISPLSPLSPLLPTSQIYFEVTDTGVGISPVEIKLLFEPFGQTEIGRQSQQGTGLGLAISRKYVQLMGGDIAVSSTVGVGTTFTFHIQANLVSESEISSSSRQQQIISLEPHQPQYRILVVDDADDNRLFLVKLLTSIGFAVREASNGVDAISQWSEWQPHLIFMDMRMPIMDGYAVTRAIKAREQKISSTPRQFAPLQGSKLQRFVPPHANGSPTLENPPQQTIIIALTASVFEEERHKMLSAGCDDVICKPFIQELLLEKVREYLGVKYISQIETSNTDAVLEEIQITDIERFLSQMSPKWIENVYNAAASCSDDLILKLLQQIPDDYAPLIRVFRDLANNYEFNKIMKLTKADAE